MLFEANYTERQGTFLNLHDIVYTCRSQQNRHVCNAVSYKGYHGNHNQILNASAIAHLFNYCSTLHAPTDPTLFNPEAGIIEHLL